jgi:hypothetical protein
VSSDVMLGSSSLVLTFQSFTHLRYSYSTEAGEIGMVTKSFTQAIPSGVDQIWPLSLSLLLKKSE